MQRRPDLASDAGRGQRLSHKVAGENTEGCALLPVAVPRTSPTIRSTYFVVSNLHRSQDRGSPSVHRAVRHVNGWHKRLTPGRQSFLVSASLPAIAVMQPTLVREPFHREGWVYEEKYDGWRMVAYKHGQQVRLVSRNGRDHTERFAELAAAIAALPAHTLILDGEVCVFDEDLVSQFHLLGEPHPDVVATPPMYMAFDLLYLEGLDLRARPLTDRRWRLERAIEGSAHVLPARRLPDHGLVAWELVKQRGYGGPGGQARAIAVSAGADAELAQGQGAL
jgi:hypothetical protein